MGTIYEWMVDTVSNHKDSESIYSNVNTEPLVKSFLACFSELDSEMRVILLGALTIVVAADLITRMR